VNSRPDNRRDNRPRTRSRIVPGDPGHSRQRDRIYNPPPGTADKPNRPGRKKELSGTEKIQRRGQAISRSTTIVAVLFFIFVLIYLFQSLYNLWVSPQITTEIIRTGTVESPRTISGVIIRDEQVYFAERGGQLTFSVNDFDRVKPNTVVCSIQKRDEVMDINRDIASIEEQMLELQNLRQDISVIDPGVQRINGQIKNIIEGRMHHFTALSVSEVYHLKESLNQVISTRNRMITDDNWHVRGDLGIRQQQLLNQLGMVTTPVRAEQSGIVSQIIDGFEDILTLENMRDLTREETFFNPDFDKIIPAREVAAGDPVFKVIASNIWYVAAYFPNTMVEGFEVNQVRTFYIEKNGEFFPIPMRIERIDENFTESFLLLRCTKNIIDFLNHRRVQIRTSESVRTGLKISNSAIVTRDFYVIPAEYIHDSERGGKHVLIELEDGQATVPVAVVESDARFAYIPLETVNLRMGDLLHNAVHTGDMLTLSEQVTLQGVYRVNSGYAQFMRVTLDEDSGSGAFSVLNPALNPRLKAFDHIVTNAADIKDGQIVY
jgi:hypothetical protein